MSSADGVAVKATSEEPDAVCRGWWSEAAGERHGALFMLAGTAMGVSVTDPATGDLAPPEWVDLATVEHLDALGDPEGGIQTVELGLATGAVRTAGWTAAFCDAVVAALQRLVAALAAAPPAPAPGPAVPAPAGGDPLPPAVPPAAAPAAHSGAPAGPGPFAPLPPQPTTGLPVPAPAAPGAPAVELPAPSVPPSAVVPPPFSAGPTAPAPAPVPAPAPAPATGPVVPDVVPASAGASLVLEDVVYLGGHPDEAKKKKRCTATLTDSGLVVEGPGEMSIAVAWSSVVSVEAQNSDEARFRMNLRVHRDASAVIVTQHDGSKLLLEARDCPTLPLRAAIAQLLVELPVEVA